VGHFCILKATAQKETPNNWAKKFAQSGHRVAQKLIIAYLDFFLDGVQKRKHFLMLRGQLIEDLGQVGLRARGGVVARQGSDILKPMLQK
jgi:hypothetical protein